MSEGGTQWTAPAAASTTAVLWGTTGFVSALMPEVHPVTVASASVGLGGLLLGLFSGRGIRKMFKVPGAPRWIMIGALGLALYMPLFYVSVTWSGVAVGTIASIGTGPLFAGILERLIDRKAVTRRWAVASGAIIVGAALLIAGREPGSLRMSEGMLMPGVAAGLISGATYAIYAFAIGRLVTLCKTLPGGMPHRTAVSSVQLTAALPMLAVLVASGGHSALSAKTWPLLVYLALIPTALGHTLFAFALNRLRASTATLYTTLEPVVATVLAVIFLGETFHYAAWFGFALVAIGLTALNIPTRNIQEVSGIAAESAVVASHRPGGTGTPQQRGRLEHRS